MSKWFRSVRLDEELTPKIAERYIRVFARVSAVPGHMGVLDSMESMLGPRHTFTNITSLDLARLLSRASGQWRHGNLLP